jgi:hypothetical protein
MANPLTFILPLKPGVDLTDLAAAIAAEQPTIDAALEAIGTVHFARFVLLDGSSPNLQPKPGGTGPFSLAVITSYDGDFDVYIQDFVNKLGLVFNALLSFSADGAGLVPVASNVAAFTAYIAANDASQQPPNNKFPLYNAYHYTVQQVLAAAPPA